MNAVWMLVACLLLSLMSVCVKLAAPHFNTASIVFMRGAVPCLLLLAWVCWRHLPLKTPHWRGHLWRSLTGTLAMMCFFASIARLPLATAVTLSNTLALFMGLNLALRSGGIDKRVALALGMGFLGVVMLLQPTFARDQWLGGVLGLAAGFFGSVAQLNLRELGRQGEPEWRTVFYFSLISAVASLPLAGLMPTGDVAAEISTQSVWLGALTLAGVGVFGGAGQLALSRAYSSGRTLVTASLLYANVVFASLFGVLIWHDRLDTLAWLGILTIVAAGLLSTRELRQPARSTLD